VVDPMPMNQCYPYGVKLAKSLAYGRVLYSRKHVAIGQS